VINLPYSLFHSGASSRPEARGLALPVLQLLELIALECVGCLNDAWSVLQLTGIRDYSGRLSPESENLN